MNRTSKSVVSFLISVFVSAGILNGDQEPAAPKKDLPLPGETFLVKNSQAFVILPSTDLRQKPQPWIWYAPTLLGLQDSHWEGFFRSQELVDFVIEHARAADAKSPPKK